MPGDSVAEKSDRDRVQYRRWIEDGLIEPTIGNVVDHDEIEEAVLEDCRQYAPISIAYDPWNAAALASRLSGAGAPVVEFVQGIRSYTAPCKELEAMLAEGKLEHGDNAVLTWMAANLHYQVDKNDNRMPTKKHSIGRIDGMAALLMCLGRALADDSNRNIDGYLSNPLVL
jgi:phage terminase large subunit-like protein